VSRERVPTPQELRASQARLRRLFSGQEPVELRTGVVPMQNGRTMLVGAPQVALGQPLATRRSGLVVPASAAGVAPLDLIATFMTGRELFGVEVTPAVAEDHLRRLSFTDVLQFIASTLATYRVLGGDAHEADLAFAEKWLKEPARSRAERLLRNPARRLIAPQSLFVLAKLAAVHCSDDTPAGVEPGSHAAALFGAAEVINIPRLPARVGGTAVKPLYSYLVANQHLHQPLDVDLELARFVRQWMELPGERADDSHVIDLPAVFLETIGVSLEDVLAVAVTMWAAGVDGQLRHDKKAFTGLGWSEERLNAVLSLFTTDLQTLRSALQSAASTGDGLVWDISPLERYPVVELEDGSLLVMDPNLLMRRVACCAMTSSPRWRRAGTRSAPAGWRPACSTWPRPTRWNRCTPWPGRACPAPGSSTMRRSGRRSPGRAAGLPTLQSTTATRGWWWRSLPAS
jgi:hypothetical protein